MSLDGVNIHRVPATCQGDLSTAVLLILMTFLRKQTHLVDEETEETGVP